ncbi:MAG: OmpH family outer membrane protein [Chitinophagaceae bacterium]|nr:OmpH family outer membrane protein [Chitinophagaceae bacterium]
MKNILLAVNAVLVIAVAVLFYLYFSQSREIHSKSFNAVTPANFKVAYFDLDSLNSQYSGLKEMRQYLNSRDTMIGKQLAQMRDQYINKVKQYQQKGPSLSQQEQSTYEQELMRMKNEYETTEQQKRQEQQAEYVRRTQEIKLKIQDFLKDYCRQKGLSFVFASDEMDNLYYKDSAYNVTSEVVKLLNEQYQKPLK